MPSSRGDRARRRRMIAGDHHRRDARGRCRRRRRPSPRGAAGRSGRPARGTRAPASTASGSLPAGSVRPLAPRDRQHAQSFRGHALRRGEHRRAVQRFVAVGAGRRSCTAAARFRARPSCTAIAPAPVRCSVVMRLRSESNGSSWTRGAAASSAALSNPASAAAWNSAVSVGSPVTRPCAAAVRVVGQRQRREEAAHRLAARRGLPVASRGARAMDLDDAHPVLGQRAGLVRADARHRAQRLHGGQAPDEGVLLRELGRAQRERDGDDGRKGFRDRRDREADGGQEQQQRGLAARAGRPRTRWRRSR